MLHVKSTQTLEDCPKVLSCAFAFENVYLPLALSAFGWAVNTQGRKGLAE